MTNIDISELKILYFDIPTIKNITWKYMTNIDVSEIKIIYFDISNIKIAYEIMWQILMSVG